MNDTRGKPRYASGRRSLAATAGLVVVLGLLGAALPAADWQPYRDQVHAVTLPELPPVLPDGPHQGLFAAQCRLCHSPRLVLTQPRLSAKQWTAVVAKMANTYGALIPPEQQKDIVDYLTAVHGDRP
jgi:hypothetical protein